MILDVFGGSSDGIIVGGKTEGGFVIVVEEDLGGYVERVWKNL